MNPFFYRYALTFALGIFLVTLPLRIAIANPQLVKNLDTVMEIPEIESVTSSEAHMYVLSGREGLIVFRTTADSLQWLYSSSGLANRGDRMVTDIRFSYLFGRDGRLTVIEPTSVLGVYSSTRLDDDPNDIARIGNDLYLADDDYGLRTLSLETSESVDRPPEPVFEHNQPIVSIARISDQLFAIDSENRLLLFEKEDGELNSNGSQQLPQGSQRLHTSSNRLYVTTENGGIYRIRSDGRTDELFEIEEEITHLIQWNDSYLIRGESSRIWIASQGVRPTLFRDDPSAGNHITTFKEQLWISEHRQLSRWVDSEHIATFDDTDDTNRTNSTPDNQPVDEPLRLASIDDLVIPYPRVLLLTLSLESDHNVQDISFQQKSSIDGIRIRGNGLYWQPSSSDVGSHAISIIATNREGQTDSTSFNVNVRPFNSPPRFSPVRNLSIPVNEEFTIPFQASDPDGSNPDLIRYIGVDLPDGASLDEGSGEFEWTPTRRQAGEHEFQVIATDQYGAASSMDITIKVVELERGDS